MNQQNHLITSSTPITSTSFSTINNYSSPHSPISNNNDPLNSSSAILSPSYSSTTNSNNAEEEEEEEEGDSRRVNELETPPTESASPELELEIDQLDEDQEMEEPVIISVKLDKGKGKEVVRKLTLKVQDISTSSVCHQDRVSFFILFFASFLFSVYVLQERSS